MVSRYEEGQIRRLLDLSHSWQLLLLPFPSLWVVSCLIIQMKILCSCQPCTKRVQQSSLALQHYHTTAMYFSTSSLSSVSVSLLLSSSVFNSSLLLKSRSLHSPHPPLLTPLSVYLQAYHYLFHPPLTLTWSYLIFPSFPPLSFVSLSFPPFYSSSHSSHLITYHLISPYLAP